MGSKAVKRPMVNPRVHAFLSAMEHECKPLSKSELVVACALMLAVALRDRPALWSRVLAFLPRFARREASARQWHELLASGDVDRTLDDA